MRLSYAVMFKKVKVLSPLSQTRSVCVIFSLSYIPATWLWNPYWGPAHSHWEPACARRSLHSHLLKDDGTPQALQQIIRKSCRGFLLREKYRCILFSLFPVMSLWRCWTFLQKPMLITWWQRAHTCYRKFIKCKNLF